MILWSLQGKTSIDSAVLCSAYCYSRESSCMLLMQQGSATYREITRNTGTKTHKAAIVSTWIHIRIMAVRICAVQLMEALYSPLQNVRHLVPIR